MGRWHAQEAVQALKRSIDHETRAFVVWMPGANPDPPGLSDWLRERTHVDLRGRMRDGQVSGEGLVQLVAGALGIPPRQARTWLDQRLPPAPDAGRSPGAEDR